MDVTKKLKHLFLEKELTAQKFAKMMNLSQPGLTYKMKNNAYSVEDLVKIAELLDCKLEINFVLENGDKI